MADSIRPLTWADDRIHRMKRALSHYEKQALQNSRITHGQALLMPAVPNTEVEELIAIGFHPRFIHCVEERQDLADALYTHYWDEITVHWEEVSRFLARVRSREGFAYVHLDYCGHLRTDQVSGIERAIAHLASTAHLRVSVMLSRRPDDQRDFEFMYTERILRNLTAAARAIDDSYPWNDVLEPVLALHDDPTIAIAAIMFTATMFGLRGYEYTDACITEGGPFLPRLAGRFRIRNLERFHYSEADNSNAMGTIWMNVAPFVGEEGRQETTVEALFALLRALAQPSIAFLNPVLYDS